MITRNSYSKAIDRINGKLAKRIAAYTRESNEKNVHDLRTAIRRLIAAVELLPRKLRKKKRIVKHVTAYDRLLKANAKTRDLDVIISKIERHRDGSQPKYSHLLAELRILRKDNSKRGHKMALSLKHHPRLQIPIKPLSSDDLEKRYYKIVTRYSSRIKKRVPIVVENPYEKEELHLLREDTRKLRYILDLGSYGKASKNISTLKAWQDILGAVHDSDIFIQRLEKMKDPTVNSLLYEEEMIRKQNYEKFRSMMKSQSLPKLTPD